MNKKSKPIINNYSFDRVNHLWLAKSNYDIIDEFYGVWYKRKDMPKDFAREKVSGNDFRKETVYYPVYKYLTDTDVFWDTQSTSSSGIYAGSTKVGSLSTTTTTSHERRNVKKTSGIIVVKHNDALRIEKVSLSGAMELDMDKNITVPAYGHKLVFSREEHRENGLREGARGERRNASTRTAIDVHMILVPIMRWTTTYKKKEYFYELNLNNGSWLAHFPQKFPYFLDKCLIFTIYNLLRILCLVLPPYFLYSLFKIHAFGLLGSFSNLFYTALLLLLVVGGFIFSIGTHYKFHQFERYTYSFNPKVILSKYKWSELGASLFFIVVIICLSLFAYTKLL